MEYGYLCQWQTLSRRIHHSINDPFHITFLASLTGLLLKDYFYITTIIIFVILFVNQLFFVYQINSNDFQLHFTFASRLH